MNTFSFNIQSDEQATKHEEFLELLAVLTDEDDRDEEVLFQMMMES